MAILGSNSITGITTAASGTDALYRGYLDDRGQIPPITGNTNKFLTTHGTTISWDTLGGYTEYTSSGTYTYTIPTNAKYFRIHCVGAGGGGGSGSTTGGSSWSANAMTRWFARTARFDTYCMTYSSATNILAGGAALGLAVSSNAITWTIRTAGMSPSQTIQDIEYFSTANPQYIACGSAGGVICSTNGVEWTMRTAALAASSVTTVCFGASVYMATVGPALSTSTDSINWTLRTSQFTGVITESIFRSPNFYVVGNNAKYNISTDGINWVLRTTNFPNVTKMIINPSNTLYVQGSTLNNGISSSTDGINWTVRTVAPIANNSINALAYNGNEYFLANGGGAYMSSTDTISWTLRTGVHSTLGPRNAFYVPNTASMVFGNGAALGVTPDNPPAVSGPGGGAGANASWQIPKDLISGSTITVNVGSAGTGGVAGGAASVDGAATIVNFTGSGGGTYSLRVEGGKAGSSSGALLGGAGGTVAPDTSGAYRAVPGGAGGYGVPTPYGGGGAPNMPAAQSSTGGGGGSYASRETSFDGSTSGGAGGSYWYNGGNIYQADPGGNKGGVEVVSPTRKSGALAATGPSGAGVQAISEPSLWTQRTVGGVALLNASSVRTIRYLNSQWICCSNYALSTSTNTAYWTLRTSAIIGTQNSYGAADAAYSSALTRYLLVGNNGTSGVIQTSTDLISWTLRTNVNQGTDPYIWSEFGSNVFAIASSSTNIATSTDGISWVLRTTGYATTTTSGRMRYVNNVFFITGGSGANSSTTSTDGIDWTSRTPIGGGNDIAFGQTLYTGVGVANVVVSTDLVVWVLRTALSSSPCTQSIGFNNNVWVAAMAASGSTGQAFCSSTDTINWNQRGSIGTNYGINYTSVVCANNQALLYGTLSSFPGIYVGYLGAKRGDPANGVMGSGGSGGSFDGTNNAGGNGGAGGPGYVRIEWR